MNLDALIDDVSFKFEPFPHQFDFKNVLCTSTFINIYCLKGWKQRRIREHWCYPQKGVVEHCFHPQLLRDFHSGSDGKESVCQYKRPRFDPWVRKTPVEGNGYPPQYSCLEKSMDRRTWRATAHGIAKSWTRMSNQERMHFSYCKCICLKQME